MDNNEKKEGRPIKKNGYAHARFQQARRDQRKQEAEARQRDFDKLTLEAKLAKAKGKKEQAKWQKKIAKRDEKKPAVAPKAK